MTALSIDDFNQAKLISTLSKRPVRVNDEWVVWFDIALTHVLCLALIGKLCGAGVGNLSRDILLNGYNELKYQLPDVMNPGEGWVVDYFYNRKIDAKQNDGQDWFNLIRRRLEWKSENQFPEDLLRVYLEQVYIS